jgi:pantoate--beta-alanine ligase
MTTMMNKSQLFGGCVAIRIIQSSHEMQQIALQYKRSGKTIGVVPTMGYLHDGHGSLIRAARAKTDVVITTIFVNPLQFAANEDLSRYPRDLVRDTAIAETNGADFLFTPSPEEMYPEGFGVNVSVSGVTTPFEGVFRPTHFDGVATVVAKLFHLTQPDKAYFGQKDFQQCLVVSKMVRDFAMPIEIVICPTSREQDGLAMSSRNVYLSPEGRTNATILFKALTSTQERIKNGERVRSRIEEHLQQVLGSVPHLTIDYAAAADAENLSQPDIFLPHQAIVLLLAVRLGTTRLIDNMVIEC